MEVHNIVADGSLYKELDRDGLMSVIEDRTEYTVEKDKATKSAVVIDMGDDYDDVVVYKKGSYAIKSGDKESLFNTHAEFVDLMIEFGVMEDNPNFDTNNVVATHESRFESINLGKLYQENPELCRYEPENYPALICTPEDKPFSINMYSTGTFSICADSFESLDEAVPYAENLVQDMLDKQEANGTSDVDKEKVSDLLSKIANTDTEE